MLAADGAARVLAPDRHVWDLLPAGSRGRVQYLDLLVAHPSAVKSIGGSIATWHSSWSMWFGIRSRNAPVES
jgi:hypothetical protein